MPSSWKKVIDFVTFFKTKFSFHGSQLAKLRNYIFVLAKLQLTEYACKHKRHHMFTTRNLRVCQAEPRTFYVVSLIIYQVPQNYNCSILNKVFKKFY